MTQASVVGVGSLSCHKMSWKPSVLILMCLIDTLIVDNKHDLNVYADAQEDGAKDSGKGTSKACCGPSCYSKQETPAVNGLGVSSSSSKDIDFNEWAGMCLMSQPYAVKILTTS